MDFVGDIRIQGNIPCINCEDMCKNVYEKYGQLLTGLFGFSEFHTLRATDISGPTQSVKAESLKEAKGLALN